MPRIKAYRQAEKLIPVDAAKVVTAFQCPWTKKVFSSKKYYIKHLIDLRRTRIHRRIVNRRMDRALSDLNAQPSFQDVIEWIERNCWYFLAKAKQNNNWSDKGFPTPEEFWIRITYLEVHHSNNVSNSHSAPRGKPTNWGRKDSNIPFGYSGWEGRIEYCISHQLPGVFSSDLLSSTGIHTGSGGSSCGNNYYGYSVIFWDEDWTGLLDETVMNILAEKDVHHFKYGSRWRRR